MRVDSLESFASERRPSTGSALFSRANDCYSVYMFLFCFDTLGAHVNAHNILLRNNTKSKFKALVDCVFILRAVLGRELSIKGAGACPCRMRQTDDIASAP